MIFTLHFFTDPYKDELIYSAIARYHFYSGNIDLKDTLEECFGKRTIIPTLEFGSPIHELANNIGGRYSAEHIINKHTILPYYTPFLPEDRKIQVINEIKYNNCGGIYTKLGIVAGSILKKDGIYYCATCAKNEIEVNGEAFIHREHQLQGIYLCPHHGTLLKSYMRNKRQVSRVEFIKLESDLLDLDSENQYVDYYDKMLKLSKAAYYLLNTNLIEIKRDLIINRYKNLLYERGLTTSSKRVKQRDLYDEFIAYYNKNFLRILDSEIDNNDEYNWLRVATRNCKRVVHPLRHLLLIGFLCEDIGEFFNYINIEHSYFGKGPWPCLNRASKHYHKNVVKSLVVTEDSKSRMPVGTFSCKCGFVYSRKGPDKELSDKYKIGRIKTFGHIWEAELKLVLKVKGYKLREVARIMGCDPKTILKFDKRLGINYFIFNKCITNEIIKNETIDLSAAYKEIILETINKNKDLGRTDLRKICKKEYIYLYRHHKEWLFRVLPAKVLKINSNSKVDWEKRDSEYLQALEDKYRELIKAEKPIRITKSALGRALGIIDNLEKNIDKLPKASRFLENVFESVEEFQIRRCKKRIDRLLESNTQVRLWEIKKIAGIKDKSFTNIEGRIKEYINLKTMGG